MISRETTVSSALSVDPRIRGILKGHGIRFVGRDASPLDSIEKVGRANGLGEEKIDRMVEEMNSLGKNEEIKKAVSLTERASGELKKMIKGKGANGIRLRLVSDGCGLYVYDMDFGRRAVGTEEKIKSRGVEIYMEKKSAPMMNGTVIDFIPAKKGFVFNNPNVKD